MRKLYIGKNIKHLRKEKKLTQEQVGEIIGVKKAAVSTYEIGKNFPTVEGLIKIADFFEVNLDALFYSDLTGEVGSDRVEEPQEPYQDDFSRLMMRRIKELEREIKEHAPDLAKRLEL